MISTESTPSSKPAIEDAPAWDDQLLRNPHAVADKRGRVQRMFAAIAPSYDLNNRLHSLWMDQHWRHKAVKLADVDAGRHDRRCRLRHRRSDAEIRPGLVRRNQRGQGTRYRVLPPRDRVMGIDFTYEMLPLARAKAAARAVSGRRRIQHAGADHPVRLRRRHGTAAAGRLGGYRVDRLRHPQRRRSGRRDPRVLPRPAPRRTAGHPGILAARPTRSCAAFTTSTSAKSCPRTATLISGDKTGAYKYLPESVNTFIGREQMCR